MESELPPDTEQQLDLNGFRFSIPRHIRYSEYKNEYYSGVIFTTPEGSTYDIVFNPHFGNRLMWRRPDNSWHDIPFKSDTFGFLPLGITVSVI